MDAPPLTLSGEMIQLHAEICSALGDANRIRILYALAEQPYTVNELTEMMNTSQPTTSRHLKTLRERGLVRAVRLGPNVEYSLADTRLIEALDLLRGVLKDRLAHRAGLMGEE